MSQEPSQRAVPLEHVSALDAKEEVLELRERIRRHDHLYYSVGEPGISDAAYDRLFRRLKALEAALPELGAEDSPTRRVGAPPREGFSSVEHAVAMLSLDSAQDEAEVRRFNERVRGATGSDMVEYVLDPKLDGVSIEAVFETGVLARAVTRGDGRVGEGVPDNIRTICSVQLRLWTGERPAPPLLSIRGEVLMTLSSFEELNRRLAEEDERPVGNPGNVAFGAIRPLDCFAYEILEIRGDAFETNGAALEVLKEWGFRLPDRVQTARDVEEIVEYHAAYAQDRDTLDYEIDGIVIKVNDLGERAETGSTSHHPRWALAYKFEPRKEVTRIHRIAVQVGRTGALTPVALLLPVEVGCVTVSRASLHNREELARKDIREGDRVRQRAGDVIPQVIEVLDRERGERSPPFRMPGTCPNCGTPVLEVGPATFLSQPEGGRARPHHPHPVRPRPRRGRVDSADGELHPVERRQTAGSLRFRGGVHPHRHIRTRLHHRRLGTPVWPPREQHANQYAYDAALDHPTAAKHSLEAFPPSPERTALGMLPDDVLARDR